MSKCGYVINSLLMVANAVFVVVGLFKGDYKAACLSAFAAGWCASFMFFDER